MISKYRLSSMIIILFFFSCKMKNRYESFQLKGKCIDWVSNEPIAGVTMELYAGYKGGMLFAGKSEIVGKVTTGADGSYTIIPQRSEYLRGFSEPYLLLQITSSKGYVTGDTTIMVEMKGVNEDFSGVIHHDFKFGKTSILKLIINSGPDVDTGTICWIEAVNSNPDLEWYGTKLLGSQPELVRDNFVGVPYFKGAVHNGFLFFEVLVNDTCTISGRKFHRPDTSEAIPLMRVFCGEGDTTVVPYTY